MEYETAHEIIAKEIGGKNWAESKEIAARLQRMIEYAISRVDYYENLRDRFLTIALGLFAGSAAFGGLLAGLLSGTNIVVISLAVVAVLALLFTSLLLLYRYNATTSPEYTYRKIADIRSWYYKYHLTSALPIELRGGLSEREQVAGLQEGLKKFVRRWGEYAEDKQFVAEDIEQVFILFQLQKLKRDATNELSRIFVGGVSCAIAFSILAALAWLLVSVFGWVNSGS